MSMRAAISCHQKSYYPSPSQRNNTPKNSKKPSLIGLQSASFSVDVLKSTMTVSWTSRMLKVLTLSLLSECIIAFSFESRHRGVLTMKRRTPSFIFPHCSHDHHRTTHTGTTCCLELSADVDFEYIPPNPKKLFTSTSTSQQEQLLSSVYPPGTPAGLRGEAVRSALLSKRCIAWDLTPSSSSSSSISNPLACGWIRVQGKGTLDFLQNKFTQSFESSKQTFTKACLLTPKGRVIDQISVALLDPSEAFIMTSPGHAGSTLFDRLDPLIFPMDQVKLIDESKQTKIFSIASTNIQHVQGAIETYLKPMLKKLNYNVVEERSTLSSLQVPSSDSSFVQYTMKRMTDDKEDEQEMTMTILPQVHLSPCACQGYTIVLAGSNDNSAIKERIWEALVGDENSNGPVEIGMLEYETLRIETAWPAYGKEVTAGLQDKKKKMGTKKEEETGVLLEEKKSLSTTPLAPANPVELYWERDFVNTEKGCYLGQEGIASVLKNPRGPPRTLYSVIFEDEGNIYDHESEGDNSDVENLTTTPMAGNDLFVLGSNEQIKVGTLTSVADPGGTGEPCTVALALIKRSDSILKQMKDMDLEVGYDNPFDESSNDPLWSSNPTPNFGTMGGGINDENSNAVASGIIQPPPLEPLDGLEVIVGGTFTIGKLQAVPSRRFVHGQNMFEVAVANNGVGEEMDGSVMGVRFSDVEVGRTSPSQDEDILVASANNDLNTVTIDSSEAPSVGFDIDSTEDTDLELALEEAAKAQAEAEAAAAEAQRKAEKMEMLKKRAEEAMARRKKNKEQAMKQSESVDEGNDEDAALAAEKKRKAEKMDMLRKRAEEAMARRKQKKDQGQ